MCNGNFFKLFYLFFFFLRKFFYFTLSLLQLKWALAGSI